jgi:sigma-B regulation protein RsbU (phosphoserine phosphatase)
MKINASNQFSKMLNFLLMFSILGISSLLIDSCSKKTEPSKEQKEKVEKSLSVFAESLATSNIDSATSYNLLKSYLEKNEFIYGAAWAVNSTDNNGKKNEFCTYVYNHKDMKMMKVLPSFKTEDWYTGPVNTQKGYWSKPYFDTEGGEIDMITYSIPVYSKDGTNKLLGVITSDLPLE